MQHASGQSLHLWQMRINGCWAESRRAMQSTSPPQGTPPRIASGACRHPPLGRPSWSTTSRSGPVPPCRPWSSCLRSSRVIASGWLPVKISQPVNDCPKRPLNIGRRPEQHHVHIGTTGPAASSPTADPALREVASVLPGPRSTRCAGVGGRSKASGRRVHRPGAQVGELAIQGDGAAPGLAIHHQRVHALHGQGRAQGLQQVVLGPELAVGPALAPCAPCGARTVAQAMGLGRGEPVQACRPPPITMPCCGGVASSKFTSQAVKAVGCRAAAAQRAVDQRLADRRCQSSGTRCPLATAITLRRWRITASSAGASLTASSILRAPRPCIARRGRR